MSRAPKVRLADLSPEARKRARKLKRDAEFLAREQFVRHCEAHGLPAPTPELKFHPRRKWRFDWCWENGKVALELEGGAFTRGRHTRGVGFIKDMEKYSEAAIAGYKVLRIQPRDLYDPATMEMVKRALGL